MQWSTAVDIVAGERIETDYVACRSLKCEERNKRYQQPTVELVRLGEEKSHEPTANPTAKRKYTRKDVKG
jgi:hypothetical protein